MRRAVDIGQIFLDIAKKSANGQGGYLSPLKLLKLVYIAHGWMLAIHDERLVEEEIEVWKYGPVIPPLYHAVKRYRGEGGGSITKNISEASIDDLSDEEKYVIEKTFEIYGKHSAWDLSNMTHKIGSPWDTCVNDEINIIPEYLIKSYYKELGMKASLSAA